MRQASSYKFCLLALPLLIDGALAATPTITPIDPAENGFTYSANPTLKFSIAADAAITTVTVDIAATPYSPVHDPVTGTWSFTAANLNDGPHTYSITVVDANTNSGDTTVDFTNDLASPAITISSPANNHAVVNPFVTFSGTFSGLNRNQIGSLALRVGGLAGTAYSAYVDWNANDEHAGTYYCFLPLDAGWRWVNAIVTSPGGVQAQTGINVHVFEPPVITFQDGANYAFKNPWIVGSYLTDSSFWLSSISLSGTASIQFSVQNSIGNPAGYDSFNAIASDYIPNGVYQAVFTYTTSSSESFTITKNVTFDYTAPTISLISPVITEPVPGESYSRTILLGNTAQFAVSDPLDSYGNPGSGIDYVYNYRYNSCLGGNLSWDGSTFTVTNIPNGDYHEAIYAIDAAGNWGVYDCQLRVNTVKPTFSNLSPAEGGYLGASSPILTGNYACPGQFPVKGSTLQVSAIDSSNQPYYGVSIDSADSTSFSLRVSIHPYNPPPDGPLTLHLTVENDPGAGSGLSSDELVWTVNIDFTPPTITPSNLIDIQLGGTTSQIVDNHSNTVQFEVTDLYGIQSIIVYEGYGNQLQADLNGSTLSVPGLPDGTHTLQIQATDNHGNQGEWFNITFLVDHTPPAITPINLADIQVQGTNYKIVANHGNTAEFQVADVYTGVQYIIVIEGSQILNQATFTNGTLFVPNLTNGTHTLLIHATDNAGNAAESYAITFIVDHTPPQRGASTATLTGLTASMNITSAFSWTVSSVTEIEGDISHAADYTRTYSGIEIQPGINGTHHYQVSVIDAFGLSANFSWDVNVIRTPPVIYLTTPSPNGYLYNPDPMIKGYFVSQEGAFVETAYLTIEITECPSGTHEFSQTVSVDSFTITPIGTWPNGSYTITAKIPDEFWNWSEVVSLQFEVETPEPPGEDFKVELTAPDPVCNGDSVTIVANCSNNTGKVKIPVSDVNFLIDQNTNTIEVINQVLYYTSIGTLTITGRATGPGTYHINASCEADAKSRPITVVEVGSVTVDSDSVAEGRSFKFTPHPTPATASFPKAPSWSILSGQSLVSGNISGTGYSAFVHTKAPCTVGGTILLEFKYYSGATKTVTVTLVSVTNASMTPNPIPANGTATSQGSVTKSPSDRTIIWSIIGDNHGCIIDSSGKVTAGTDGAALTIHAEDSEISERYSECTLNVVKLTLKSVAFNGAKNHKIINYNADYEGDGSAPYSSPEWTATGTSNPICYEKSSTQDLGTVITVTPSVSVNVTLKVSQGGATDTFGGKALSGGDNNVTLSTSNIKTVSNIQKKSDWSLDFTWSMDGTTFNTMGLTSNKIFTTYGPPIGSLTEKRVERCTEKADKKSSAFGASVGIGRDATSHDKFQLGSSFRDNAWHVLDGPKADCVTLCTLMKNMMELIGIPEGELRFVYACHKSWDGIWSPSDDANEIYNGSDLGFDSGGYNSYECCYYIETAWWEGGSGDYRVSAISVLEKWAGPNRDAVFNHQCPENNLATVVPWPGNATVPNVLGLSQNAAFDAINQAGLRVFSATHVHNAAAVGTVFSQNPSGGTVVSNGTSVNIVTSDGP